MARSPSLSRYFLLSLFSFPRDCRVYHGRSDVSRRNPVTRLSWLGRGPHNASLHCSEQAHFSLCFGQLIVAVSFFYLPCTFIAMNLFLRRGVCMHNKCNVSFDYLRSGSKECFTLEELSEYCLIVFHLKAVI